MNQNNAPNNNLVPVNINMIGSKMSSKREIYRFLQTECKCFLGSLETMTIYHLRDLASGKRRRISCDNVKVYQAPQYRGLKIEDMLQFAQAYPNVALCLPEEQREVLKLHRDYVSTVIYTNVGLPFSDWVQDRITDRNTLLQQQQDLNAHLDPEIAQILLNSTSISVSKGISNNLLKASAKRRRSKAQIEADKQNEELQKVALQQQLTQMTAMQQQIAELNDQIGQAHHMRSQVQQMFDDGILKQSNDGRYEAVLDPSESEHLKSQQAQASRRRPIGEIEIDQINASIDEEEKQ